MNKIKAFFAGIWHLFQPIEEKAIQDFEAKLEAAGPKLLELGVDAVKAVVPGGSEQESRDSALSNLKSKAEEEGLDLANFAKHELDTVVQLSYLAARPTIKAAEAAGKDATKEAQPAETAS